MKNKILSIMLVFMMLIVTMFALTGCGNEDNNEESNKKSSKKGNEIVSQLNGVVDDAIADWKKKEYGPTLSIVAIQNSLNKKESNYVIIASGDKKFTSAPTVKKYTESNIDGYDGKSYGNMRMMEKSSGVNYIVVYDSRNDEYYNVEVSFKEEKLNRAKKEYPVFSNAQELK